MPQSSPTAKAPLQRNRSPHHRYSPAPEHDAHRPPCRAPRTESVISGCGYPPAHSRALPYRNRQRDRTKQRSPEQSGTSLAFSVCTRSISSRNVFSLKLTFVTVGKQSLNHQPPCAVIHIGGIVRCARKPGSAPLSVHPAAAPHQRFCRKRLHSCTAGTSCRLLTLKTKHPVFHTIASSFFYPLYSSFFILLFFFLIQNSAICGDGHNLPWNKFSTLL